MEDKRESLIFYRSFYEAIRELPLVQQGEIYNTIFTFGLNFVDTKLTGISKTVRTLIKPQIEANIRKYKNGKVVKQKQKVVKQKQKVSKTEAKGKQNRSKTQGNVNVNVNVNDNDKDNDKDNDNKDPPLVEIYSKSEIDGVRHFIAYQYTHSDQMKYLIDKKGGAIYLRKSMKDYKKLASQYDEGKVFEVLKFIIADPFWSGVIKSIPQLLTKNKKTGFRKFETILDKIAEKKPKHSVDFSHFNA